MSSSSSPEEEKDDEDFESSITITIPTSSLPPPQTIQDIFDRNKDHSLYDASSLNSRDSNSNSSNNKSSSTKEAFDSNPYVAMLDATLGYEGPQNRMKFLYEYQPAFIAHNMLSKDMMNLPFSTMGANPLFKDLLLAGYYGSLSNTCEYCSCHAIAIADQKDSILRDRMIFHQARGQQSPSDQALCDVSLAMGRFPADVCTDELINLTKYYTSEEIEWIMLSLCFLGCSNFISNTFAVQLDHGAIRFSKYVPFSTSTNWDSGTNTPHGYDMSATSLNFNLNLKLNDNNNYDNTSKTIFHDSNSLMNDSSISSISRIMEHDDTDNHRIHSDRTTGTANNEGSSHHSQSHCNTDGMCEKRDSIELRNDIHEKMVPIMKVLKKCPKAMVKTMKLEIKYKSGVPGDARKACLYLKDKTGYSFPLLKSFAKSRGMIIALAAVLRDQFDKDLTQIGCTTKALCTVIFAGHIDDEHLQEDASQMIKVFAKIENKTGMKTIQIVDALLEIAEEPVPVTKEECHTLLERIEAFPGITSRKVAAILVLSRAAVQQPKPQINPAVVSEIASLLTPSEITETFFWLSLQIIFHRHHRYHEVKNNTPADCWDGTKVRSRKTQQQHVGGVQSDRNISARTNNNNDTEDADNLRAKSESNLILRKSRSGTGGLKSFRKKISKMNLIGRKSSPN